MTQFGLAQPVRRVEDPRLLKGDGRYTDDIVPAGMLHGVVLRSPHAAATFDAIDTTAAKAMPGVRAIYTCADLDADGIGGLPCAVALKNRDGSDMAAPPHPVLADAAVRHVGDPVAFIVAETPQAARDAAEAIVVNYSILPSATDLATALDAGQPLVWPEVPSNRVFDWSIGDKDATDALFATAAKVVSLTVVNNRIVVNSMEPRAAIGAYDEATGRWTLHANTQGGWLVKGLLANAVFKVDPERFRVITPDVGGGFGMKLFLYAEHALVCYAARSIGAPVKWTSERSEAFLSDTQGRDNITLGEIALDADNRFLALRTRNVANMGAYLSNFGPFIPTMAGTGVLASVYGFQQVYANVIGVFTNTVPVDAYRGAGRPESNYLVERVIDAAAAELGVDRVELRRRNMVPPSAMPHKTPVGKTYDSGDFQLVLDAALKNMDWAGFPARRAEAAKRGKRRGIGMAYYLEATGGAPTERAEIRFADDGYVDVYVGTQSTGQGHETAYVQLTVDRLGVDPDGRRHRRRAQPVFRGPGDSGDGRHGDREGPSRRIRGAGGGDRRHRVRGRAIQHRRHRSQHRHRDAGGDPAAEGEGRRGRDHAGRRRSGGDQVAHFPERLPHRRGGDRPGNRRGVRRALLGHRRCRQSGEPDDRARPGAWRRGAGPGAGAVRAHVVRRVLGPVAVGQFHGLRGAARRRPAGHRGRTDRGALRHQPARREGRRRGRRGGQPAGGDERAGRCAARRRHHEAGYAGHTRGDLEGAGIGQEGRLTR
jgi:carbon-monoxide dehydrogenase large subunit